MRISSWHVITWPTVTATPRDLITAADSFRHLGTSIQIDDGIEAKTSGSTVWGTKLEGQDLGLAWDWIEMRPGVIIQGDPMILLCNAELIDDAGQPIEDRARLLKLHHVIYALPWQKSVIAASVVFRSVWNLIAH